MNAICNYLHKKILIYAPPKSEAESEEILYGLYGILSSAAKIVIVMVIAAYLGLTKEVAFAIFAFGLIRSFSGGIHADTFLGCLISSGLFYSVIVALSLKIDPKTSFFIAAASFPAYAYYAPADVANRPVRGAHRRKMRLCTLYCLIGYFVAGLFFSSTYGNILYFSLVLQALTMLPITYKLFNKKGGEAYEEIP